ncbi:MAG TPA: ornithine cyclodeaminase family protein [Pirellulales bacterium]|jgi:ornithine cyclodeaminase/alanine dehydrogenase-like protein (mu-crystallin family)|nr:ornithine cyclodeaminase family protein [Pirellulales bacterium]
MSVLYLTEADVERLLDVPTAIEAVKEAFRRMAAGEATTVPRVRAVSKGIVLHTMSAAAAYLGLVGWKCYTSTRGGARFQVGLYDATSGDLVAMIEADRLGQLRTGAATAVAVEWLAAPEATEVGLFGSGHQAQTQLACVAAARPLRRAFVYSRSEERREAFAKRMSAELRIEVVPVDRPSEAVEDLPIVVTATSSTQPVFDGTALSEGALVCAMGSNWLSKAEIDTHVLRRADNIVCDSIAACRNEAGDFVDALEKGIFQWDRAVELADVVAGRAVGRSRLESVVVFKSVGLAIEDVAVGARVLECARAQGVGVSLPF